MRIIILMIGLLLIAACAPTQAPQQDAADTEIPPAEQKSGAPGDPFGVPNPRGDTTATTGTGDDAGEGPAAGGGGILVSAPVEISLIASDWEWTPATITVKKGDRVRLTITSESGDHGFAIPELGVNSGAFAEGETKVVEFTADKAGEYPFKCNVFCGEGHMEMKGTLIVTE